MDAPPIQYARTADGVNIAWWSWASQAELMDEYEVRYAQTSKGAAIAYGTTGNGPTLIRLPVTPLASFTDDHRTPPDIFRSGIPSSGSSALRPGGGFGAGKGDRVGCLMLV